MTWGNFVMRHLIFALPLAATLGLASMANAEVTAVINSGSLSFKGGESYTNGVLTIFDKEGIVAEEKSEKGLPMFRLGSKGKLADGFYKYSLSAATAEQVKASGLNNGRGEKARGTVNVPFSTTGMFQVAEGVLVPPQDVRGGSDGDVVE